VLASVSVRQSKQKRAKGSESVSAAWEWALAWE
jgi:hypothetical protein